MAQSLCRFCINMFEIKIIQVKHQWTKWHNMKNDENPDRDIHFLHDDETFSMPK